MRFRSGFVVALILAAYWLMAVSVSPRMGVTADEVVHLTGGYSYWKFNDYRLHPENGTLPMRLAALPLLGMDLKFPPLDREEWLASKVDRLGNLFFFTLDNPVAAMLLRARMMVALVGVFVVWLTWRWARGLFGANAGWLALFLAAFCPALLAHGGLATSDMALTACVLGALTLVWKLLHRATWLRLALAILACGAAFLAKMSGVLIVPLIAALLVMRWLRRAPLVLAFGAHVRRLRSRAAVIAASAALMMAVGGGSIVVLWAGYGFRYEAFNAKLSANQGLYFSWDVILEREAPPWSDESSLMRFAAPRLGARPTAMTRLVGLLRDRRLLPEAYLWGFAHTYKFSRERPAFLHGQYSRTGWRSFFPLAFVWKTTLSALVLLVAGILALLGSRQTAHRWRWLYRAAPLLAFFVVYWVMALNMHLNIGHRHILPTYPVIYVLASASVLWLRPCHSPWVARGLVAVAALHAIDSFAARPFYLSYFQPLAGGPSQGYRFLVDSSFDWGQGLPDFEKWLQSLRQSGDTRPVHLTYFGADSPRARGLAVVRFADELNDFGTRVFPAPLRGGWYAISATHYQAVYLAVRGTWTKAHEDLYRELMKRLSNAPAPPSTDEAARQRLIRDTMDYETLQFGRIIHFLHTRKPERLIGGSILLFQLTDDEVRFALYAPWTDFLPYTH